MKAELLALITRPRQRTDSTVRRILHPLVLSNARYRNWSKHTAVDGLADRAPHPCRRDGILPEERRPHERWQTDLLYLRIADRWYFLVTGLDASSRYVVHAQPAVVGDNRAPCTAAAFKELVRRFALEHIRIRTYHPESNGLLERFHRSTHEAVADASFANLRAARAIITPWVPYDNEERLHAGLGYLTPAEFYRGNRAARIAER